MGKWIYSISIVKDDTMNEYYVHMVQMFNIITGNYRNAKIVSVQTLGQKDCNKIMYIGFIVYKYWEMPLWLQKIKSFKLFKKKEER